MKPEWRAFLENKGAEYDDGKVATFGNPERELRLVTAGDVIADLSHTGLVSAHGDDVADFLQGQLTNDIGAVTDTHSQLTAYCSPKGRMLANFRVFKRGDTYFLHLPREQVESTLKRLRMFVLASRVTLEDASEGLVRLGFSGPTAGSELLDHFGAIPEQPDDALERDGVTLIRLPGPHPRFELFGELDAMQRLWTVLDVRAAPVGAAPWELLDILAGIPVIYPETSDEFVPQMANMHLINGVSFKKGCYTGQEVVARMQYLGKLKRRLYRAHLDSEACPAPATPLYSPDADQSAGKVLTARPSPEGGCELLAVVEVAARARGDLRVESPEGPPLEFRELPYAWEAE